MPKYCVRYKSVKPGEGWTSEMLVDVPASRIPRMEWCMAVLKGARLLDKLEGGIVIGCQLDAIRTKWWERKHEATKTAK